MFSRFFTDTGTKFIRTDSLISISDVDDGSQCIVTWYAGDEAHPCRAIGSAQENMERLKAEELELIAQAAERQNRHDRGLPLLPIPRGKVSR